MKNIKVRQITKDELSWVNSCYEKVGFKTSNFHNEFIVLAEVDGVNCGLGRLVTIDEENLELGGIFVDDNYRGLGVATKVVSFLCNESKLTGKIIWCLPFEDLKGFYNDFGFDNPKTSFPKEISEKHLWCNTNGGYAKKVLLLSKHIE